MLSKIRQSLGSFFATLLLGLLIASFAVWGIGDIFGQGRGRVVAEVGSTPIEAQAYYAEFQRTFNRLQQQADQAIDREQAIQFGLHIRVLSQMVDKALLDHKARELGLRASDAQIREKIREIGAFSGPAGEFNLAIYEQLLRSNGYTIPEFEALVARDIARAQLIDAAVSATPVPEPLSEALFRYRYETRRGDIVTVPASAITLETEPGDDELRPIYENNQSAFRTPEYRAVTSLFLDPARMADPNAIDDEALRQAYEQRESEFNEPERRTVLLLTLDTAGESGIRSAYERIDGAESFEAVATDLTGLSVEDLTLGDKSRSALRDTYGPSIAEAVFAVGEGGVTQPLQSAFGWHVFKVSEVKPGVSRSFEEVKAQLAQELAADRARDRVYDLSIEVEDRLAQGESLEAVAADLSLPLSAADQISQEGLGPDGKLVATQPSLIPVLDTAFELLPSDDPELIDYADGGYAFVRIDGITQPEVKPFEAVRGQVEDRWRAQERQRLAGLKAEELLERLRAGAEPQSLADDSGGDYIAPEPVTRQERGGEVMSRQIAELMFSLDEGASDIAPASTGDGYVIVRTNAVTPGAPDENREQFERLHDQLKGQMNNELLVLLRDAIRNRVDVETKPEVIRRLLDQQQG